MGRIARFALFGTVPSRLPTPRSQAFFRTNLPALTPRRLVQIIIAPRPDAAPRSHSETPVDSVPIARRRRWGYVSASRPRSARRRSAAGRRRASRKIDAPHLAVGRTWNACCQDPMTYPRHMQGPTAATRKPARRTDGGVGRSPGRLAGAGARFQSQPTQQRTRAIIIHTGAVARWRVRLDADCRAWLGRAGWSIDGDSRSIEGL